MGGQLDEAVVARLKEVVGRRPTTEHELRRLAEDADACERLLHGRLERRQRRLEALTVDPTAPLGEIAAELRLVRELTDELEDLRSLIADLDERVRELRAGWAGRR